MNNIPIEGYILLIGCVIIFLITFFSIYGLALYKFFFERWKWEVVEEGNDKFKRAQTPREFITTSRYRTSWSKIEDKDEGYVIFYRKYVKYKLTNQYTGSVKMKKVYLD